MNPAEQKQKRFVLITGIFAALIFFTTTMNQFATRSMYIRVVTSLILAALAFASIWVIYYIIRFIFRLFRRSK